MNSNNGLKSRLLAIWQFQLGRLLYQSGIAGWHVKLHEFTMRQLQKASHKGHSQAQQLISKLLAYKGVSVLDKRAGVALLASQAEKGDAESQFLYAEMLLKSDTVLAEQTSAGNWYLAAAKQGHIMAALRLSKAYEQGLYGLEQDSAQAEYWSKQFMQHSKNMSSDS